MSIAASQPAETYFHPTVASNPDFRPAVVVSVLGPRAATFAGFDAGGNLMAFEKYTAPEAAGDWNPDFLEKSFAANPFFATAPESRVFLCDPRQLVIPEALYAEESLADWIRTCYFMEGEEDLLVTTVSGAPYRVATVCSGPMKQRVAAGKTGKGIYAMGAALLHGTPAKNGEYARVLLTADTTYLALWRDGNLLEAVAFGETEASSVAYRLHGLLHKNGVDAGGVQVFAEALYPALETIALLGDYWQLTPSGNEAADVWESVSRSFSRVRACVS